MTKDVSMRAFKCPSCGAPLEPETGTLTMKCPYCGGTVIIPESLRTPAPRSGPTMGEVFDFGLNGLDMNQIVGNAMHLPQAISLAKQGQIDEAANMYSQITGMEHADAVEAMKAMAAGHAVSLTPGRPGTNWQTVDISGSQPASVQASSTPVTFSSSSFSTGPSGATGQKSGGCGLLVGIIVGAVILVGLLAGGAIFVFGGGQFGLPGVQLGFASKALTFGSEGIGPGQFEDARSLGVDGNGNITVADYQDGRVQTFDPTGKFISGFQVTTDGKPTHLISMAVGRDGTIYVAHDFKIFAYNSQGQEVSEIGDDTHHYMEVTVGGDGKLYAISNDEDIVRFNSDHSVDLEVPGTFSNVTGDQELSTHLAVDGLGNMYVIGEFNYLGLKFSPAGKFINRFGGKAPSGSDGQPGKFTMPLAIAVDGYGRVYVADFGNIQVFDADGAYLNSIDPGSGSYGLTVDNNNNLYAVTINKTVVKMTVQKPSSQ